jgi:hypothetical protein
MNLFHDVILQVNIVGQWRWQPEPSEGYAVRGVYHLLTSQGVTSFDD